MNWSMGSRPSTAQYARIVLYNPSLLTRQVLCSRWLHAMRFFSLSNRFLFLYISQTKTRCLLESFLGTNHGRFRNACRIRRELLPLPTWYW